MNGLQGLLALARGYMGAQAEQQQKQELLRREAERQALDEAYRQKTLNMQQEAFRASEEHRAFMEGNAAAELAMRGQELAANEAWRQGGPDREAATLRNQTGATLAMMLGRDRLPDTPAYDAAALIGHAVDKWQQNPGIAPAQVTPSPVPSVLMRNITGSDVDPRTKDPREAMVQEIAKRIVQRDVPAPLTNVVPKADTPGEKIAGLDQNTISSWIGRMQRTMPAGSELATAGANVSTSYRNPTETENLNASYLRDTQTARVGAAVSAKQISDYQVEMSKLAVDLEKETQPTKIAMLQEQMRNLVLQGEDMLSRRQLTDWQREAIRTTTLQGQRMFPAQLRQANAAATLAQMQPGVVSRELAQKDRALGQEDRRLDMAQAQMEKEVDALKQRGKDATDNERLKIAQDAAQLSLDTFKQDRENVLGMVKRAKETLGGASLGTGAAGLPTAVEMNGLLTVIEDHVKRGVYAQENANILKGMIYSVYKDVLAARSPAPTQ